MGIRTRLIVATMAAAVAVTVIGGAATASAAPTKGAFAEKLGSSVARALNELPSDSGQPEPGKDEQQGAPEEAVTLLAAELGISVDQARQVFRDLEKVSARGEDIVEDPAFVAIAEGLGITPQQLLTALRKVKQEMGEKLAEKAPGGCAAK